MHITVATKPLAEATALLAAMTPKQMTPLVPILGHCLITDDGQGGALFATTDTDLQAQIRLPNQQLKVAGEEPESIAVKMPVLLAQARSASEAAETVTMKITGNFRLSLKSKRSKALLLGIDPGEYPHMDWETPEPDLSIPASDLHRLLQSVMPSVDDAKYDLKALTGVGLVRSGMLVRSASTDQARMTSCTVPVADRCEQPLNLLLPKNLVKHTIKLAAKRNDELVSIGRGTRTNSIFVWAGDTILASRELRLSFPDITPFINLATDQRIEVPVDELGRVLDAAIPFACDQRTGDIARILVNYAGGQLGIACQNTQAGEFEAEVAAESIGIESCGFIMNAEFLRDFLATLKSNGASNRLAIVPPMYSPAAIQMFAANGANGDAPSLRSWAMTMK